ncbi:hypothetical protein MJO28_012349, partial [Puccinia striiformis f. sp. tritici]
LNTNDSAKGNPIIPLDKTETVQQLRDLLGAGEVGTRDKGSALNHVDADIDIIPGTPKRKSTELEFQSRLLKMLYKAVAAEGAGKQAKADMFYVICAAISTPNPEKSSVDSARPISSVPNVDLTVAMKLPVQTQQVPK